MGDRCTIEKRYSQDTKALIRVKRENAERDGVGSKLPHNIAPVATPQIAGYGQIMQQTGNAATTATPAATPAGGSAPPAGTPAFTTFTGSMPGMPPVAGAPAGTNNAETFDPHSGWSVCPLPGKQIKCTVHMPEQSK